MVMKKTYDFRLETLLNSVLVAVHLAPFVRSFVLLLSFFFTVFVCIFGLEIGLLPDFTQW